MKHKRTRSIIGELNALTWELHQALALLIEHLEAGTLVGDTVVFNGVTLLDAMNEARAALPKAQS